MKSICILFYQLKYVYNNDLVPDSIKIPTLPDKRVQNSLLWVSKFFEPFLPTSKKKNPKNPKPHICLPNPHMKKIYPTCSPHHSPLSQKDTITIHLESLSPI